MSAILVDAREARAAAERALDTSQRMLGTCAIAINGAAARGECSTFVALGECYPEEYTSSSDSDLLGNDGRAVVNKLASCGYRVIIEKRNVNGYFSIVKSTKIEFGLLISW